MTETKDFAILSNLAFTICRPARYVEVVEKYYKLDLKLNFVIPDSSSYTEA